MKNNIMGRDPLESLFDSLGILVDTLPKKLDYPLYHKTKSFGQVNLYNSDNEYVVEVSAPGFHKEELSLEIKDGVLVIEGKRENKEVKKYYRQEFTSDSFLREFTVPEDISGEIEAKFENGILLVSLKKKKIPKDESKKIEIK